MSTHPFRLGLVLLVCAAFAAPSIAEPPVTGIRWQLDLDEARAKAEKEQKLLLVHFTAPWCGPCARLDATVYNQPSVAQVVHTSYVPVKLNVDEYPATRERFGIVSVPTDVVITPDGHVIEKFNPPASPMAYVGKVGQLAHGYAHQKLRDFQKSPMSTPDRQPIQDAYANLRMPQGTPNPLLDPRTAVPDGTTTNPFAKDGPQAPAPQSPAATTHLPQATGAQSPLAQSTPPAAPPAEPIITENQYALPPAAASPEPAQMAGAGTNPQPQQSLAQTQTQPPTEQAAEPGVEVAKIELPPGAPPLGFYGYCPVTMRKEFEWKKGNVEWGAIHRGRTYLFTSQELRDEFLRDPDTYAPALSGVDPVLAIDQNKVAPGLREYSFEYKGQVYMFSSKETMMKFWDNRDVYSTEVRQAMSGQPTRVVR